MFLSFYCHTKNHCIKSQHAFDNHVVTCTVTQRIIASNHNGSAFGVSALGTVTQRIIASIMSKNYVGSIAKFGQGLS